MKTVQFLATLVAVCLCLNGCYALTGCPGSAQCDPDWEAGSTDGGNVDGGSANETTVSGSDISSSPETVVVCDPKLKIVAGANWWLEGAATPVSAAFATPYEGNKFRKECGIDFVKWMWSSQDEITIHDNDHITACSGGGCYKLVRHQ